MFIIKQYLSQFPYGALATAGQLIFMAVFVGSIAWVFRKGSKTFYEKLAELPLGGPHE